MDQDLFEITEVCSSYEVWSWRISLLASDDMQLEVPLEEEPPRKPVAASMRTPEHLDSREGSIHAFSTADPEESLGPPPWLIGFSKQFKKDTAGLDRKLLGRVLEILEEISSYTPPLAARGDTFKPLTGALDGCWRYRIGDHRLVIQPVLKKAQINALALGARGSVYE